jgi:hypothetical protein
LEPSNPRFIYLPKYSKHFYEITNKYVEFKDNPMRSTFQINIANIFMRLQINMLSLETAPSGHLSRDPCLKYFSTPLVL